MIERLDYKIDAPRLLVELMMIFQRLNLEDDQILLTHRKDQPSFTIGAGSLKNDYGQGHWARTGDFAYLAKELENTLAATVIADVRDIARTYSKRIGRVRLLKLKPKTCYSLHTDKEEFRFHIPLITNPSCFFVCGDQIGRMEEVGNLYTFRTNLEHTAVNASFQDRVHLVFDTWG